MPCSVRSVRSMRESDRMLLGLSWRGILGLESCQVIASIMEACRLPPSIARHTGCKQIESSQKNSENSCGRPCLFLYSLLEKTGNSPMRNAWRVHA